MLSPIKHKHLSQFNGQGQKILINQSRLHEGSTKFLTIKNQQLFPIKTWFLQKGKFRFGQWFQLMPLVIQLKFCQQLHLFKNYQQSIIKALIYTQFKDLRNLTLDHNLVRNIEALEFIDAPNIKYLSLQNNLITNVQPLVKTDFKRLIVIQLYNNPIKSVKQLQRVNYPRLSEVYFAHMNPRSQSYPVQTFLEDISMYAKFRHFEKYNKKRGACVIRQQKVQNIILQRVLQFYN